VPAAAPLTGPRGHVAAPTRKRPGPCVPARAVGQVTRALTALDAVRLSVLPHNALGVFDSHSQPVRPLDVDSHRLSVEVRTGPLQIRGHRELIDDGAVLASVADLQMRERI